MRSPTRRPGQRAAAGFPAATHDHRACIGAALNAAGALCQDRGARLTSIRRRVLELVWTSHRPIGAYEILDRLAGDGRRAAPPTVYRALDFLLEQGLVHRIESRNAFIGCSNPGSEHVVEILLCTDCGCAAELTDARVARAVRASAADHGFEVQAQTLEVSGRCSGCRAQAAHA